MNLEKTVYIQNAPIIVDVFAEVEGRTFLIEIGDIDDKRKKALMDLYARQNGNIEFIHEPYNTDKIGYVLDNLTAYKTSDEYRKLQIAREKAITEAKREENQRLATHLAVFLTFLGGLIYFGITDLVLAAVWLGIWLAIFIVWGSIASSLS